MLGFRYTFNQPHQKTWWTDGSLDWFWKACEKQELRRWPARERTRTWRRSGRSPSGIRGSRCTSTTSDAAAAGRTKKDDAAYADLPEMLALASCPTSRSSSRARRALRAQPYPYKNIHDYLQQIIETFGPDRCFWGTDITRMPMLVSAMRDDVHRGDAVAEGPRPRAGDGRGHRRLAGLEETNQIAYARRLASIRAID